ncbi:protein-disulfide isomerase [Porphyrobacter sp. HT-58-2]|uniref:DsbA family protein n=1 Tax=Porphyrobacter sp. HT-58-2 TaxID=2023229 RepID=UPI000CDC6D67|nr:thioredoxin domain-containing protein [Porphyrobacter sp. HT-58-2]AUX70327.1 protein-disulfide isomerase [Porphyrobacter sp. HT-58-2]
MNKPLFLAAAATALALAGGSATAQQDLSRPGSAFAPQDNPGNWQTTIARTERGHLIGNPDAGTRLIEFISYTCPHCADFTARGEPALEIVLLMPGKISLEVRPVIRNGLDLTVSMLAQCGDPAGFKGRHQALMLSQADWLGKAQNAPESQIKIWLRGDKAGRMNAANALGLTAMLVKRGQSQAELDACVSNDAAAKKLLANDTADHDEFAIPGTPSFALDGKLLADVYSWEALYPVLSARFAEPAG